MKEPFISNNFIFYLQLKLYVKSSFPTASGVSSLAFSLRYTPLLTAEPSPQGEVEAVGRRHRL